MRESFSRAQGGNEGWAGFYNAVGPVARASSRPKATGGIAGRGIPARPIGFGTGAPSDATGCASTFLACPNARRGRAGACQRFAASVPFAYRCDLCHTTVRRPARHLFVFCSQTCRRAFRVGRKRLRRNFRGVPRHPYDEVWSVGPPDARAPPACGPPLDDVLSSDSLPRDDAEP